MSMDLAECLIETDQACWEAWLGQKGDPIGPEPHHLRVGQADGKGRGVFAGRRFLKGEVIERAPVLIIPAQEWSQFEKTMLYDYCYSWGDQAEDMAFALGFGSLYNHSYHPNAVYKKNLDELMIEFIALRNIEAGEEVTINYNGYPTDESPLWFEVKP